MLKHICAKNYVIIYCKIQIYSKKVSAHYTHPRRVDESPFLQSKFNDFSKRTFK
jgi:hypothetical protein